MTKSHYLFLGRGDYALSGVPLDKIDAKWRRPAELSLDPADWTFSWGLDTWRQKLDCLKALGSDRLYLVINGFELAYPSRKYPRLVEPDSANVTSEFLQQLIDYATSIDLEIVAGLSTTGHCDRALQIYPELAGVHADGKRWQCAMCHNHPQAQRFVLDVVNEVLERYHGFSGVFLHPPEVGEYCHCPDCIDLYRAQTGQDLLAQEDKVIMGWFWATGMGFLRSIYDQVLARNPRFDTYTCTIPGVWRQHFDVIGPLLPPQVNLMHWSYGRFDDNARQRIGADLRIFGKYNHRLSYATSVIFSCSGMTDSELRGNNEAKLRFVQSLGVEEIVYFVGAVWQQNRILAGTLGSL